jgi:glycosyltransferase involved in cell wall biosynthesis
MALGTNSPANRSPIVSVIIPAHNAAEYIAATLDSVFRQTYQDFEVILINDGSPDTDIFEQVIQPYLDRIVYLKQENRGPAAARNRGIMKARGEYIAFLDSDDCWLSEYLATQMQLFARTPPPDMVTADAEFFGDSPNAGKSFWQLYPPKGPLTLKNLLTRDCAIITSCTIARREVIVGAGLFDESICGPEDLDLWLRIAHRSTRLVLQRKVLARRRIHDRALTASYLRIHTEAVRVLDKLERTLPLSPDALLALQQRRLHLQACVELEEGKRYLEAGEIERARDSLQRAFAFFRTTRLRLVLVALGVAPRLTALGVRAWRRVLHAVQNTG